MIATIYFQLLPVLSGILLLLSVVVLMPKLLGRGKLGWPESIVLILALTVVAAVVLFLAGEISSAV